jgi:sugar-specific transcriptional regulator TrmB
MKKKAIVDTRSKMGQNIALPHTKPLPAVELNNKTLEIFEGIGLTEYEAKVYVAMVKHGEQTASDLSKNAKVPRGRIYDVLERLAQRGFCTLEQGSVRKYSPTHPDIAIKRAVEERELQWHQNKAKAIDIASLLLPIYTSSLERQPSDPTKFLTVLTSKPAIIQKFNELVASAKESVRAFVKQPYAMPFTASGDEPQIDPLKTAKKAGVHLKGLYEVGGSEDEIANQNEVLQYFNKMGEDIRVTKEIPIKMLIIDSHTFMFSVLHASTTQLTATVIHHSELTAAMVLVFEHYWNSATPIDVHLAKYD